MKKLNLGSLPLKLRRVTSGGNFIEEIDGLRFIAIFPVVIQHLSERLIRFHPDSHFDESFLSSIVLRGHIGVYIFFVISGFILALPFAKSALFNSKSVNLKKYYYRRITRLEPPYIVVITLLFFVLALKEKSFYSLLPHYLASIIYSHAFIFGIWTPINPPAWTLEIEVQFYILAPLLSALYFNIKSPMVRRVGLIIFLLVKTIIITQFNIPVRVYLSLINSIEYFLIGFLIADFYLNKKLGTSSRYKLFDLIAIISFFTIMFTWSWNNELIYKLLFLAFLFAMFYASFKSKYFKMFLRNKWVSAIGGMCYTIYLIHLAFAELFVTITKNILITGNFMSTLLINLIVFLPLLFIISVAFFLLIEKPCMEPDWPSKLKTYSRNVYYKFIQS